MTLLLSLGVSDDCVLMLHGPNHFYNLVYYKGKYRIMNYGELGGFFSLHTESRRTDSLAMPGCWTSSLSGYVQNYPGSGDCPAGWWDYETVYCDLCP